MNYILIAIFIVSGVAFFYYYFFGKQPLQPLKLFLGIWCFGIAIAQLQLSALEQPWSKSFWLIILGSLACFAIGALLFALLAQKLKIAQSLELAISEKKLLIAIGLLIFLTLAANLYIFLQFSTFPLLSSDPDRLRFIINKEIFGLWEYFALLPRWILPLLFFYIFLFPSKNVKKWCIISLAAIFNIFVLLGYAARLNFFFAALLIYFSYLILNIAKLNAKKIIIASLLIVIFLGAVSAVIPALRQSISYRDYPYLDEEYKKFDRFAYLATISQIKMPPQLGFALPIYLGVSFNFQALQKAIAYYPQQEQFFGGKMTLAIFNPLYKLLHLPTIAVSLPWDKIFLQWWVTGTYLLLGYIDFGLFGLFITALIFGAVSQYLYWRATKKTDFLSVFLFAYISFILIMTIYTNYFSRPELYLDLFLLLALAQSLRKNSWESAL